MLVRKFNSGLRRLRLLREPLALFLTLEELRHRGLAPRGHVKKCAAFPDLRMKLRRRRSALGESFHCVILVIADIEECVEFSDLEQIPHLGGRLQQL